MERADEIALSQLSSRGFAGSKGNQWGRPFCAVVANPINRLGSLTSPLASACLLMEANDH